MKEFEIVNAVIEYAKIDDGDRGLVTSWIGLDYGGGSSRIRRICFVSARFIHARRV